MPASGHQLDRRRAFASWQSFACLHQREGQGRRVPGSAHVPRPGLRPGLLLLLRSTRHPPSLATTSRGVHASNTASRAGSGRWGALRSEVRGGAAGAAGRGGHERSRAPQRPDLAQISPSATCRYQPITGSP